MSYHVIGETRYGELPDRIVLREDGWGSMLRYEGVPPTDYVYLPEHGKLSETERGLLKAAMLEDCAMCPYGESCNVETEQLGEGCRAGDLLRELGIEVGE